MSLSRIIYWWFWGDTGALTVKRLCKNTYCWNPLHLRTKFNVQPMPNKIEPFNTSVDLVLANQYAGHVVNYKQLNKTKLKDHPK